MLPLCSEMQREHKPTYVVLKGVKWPSVESAVPSVSAPSAASTAGYPLRLGKQLS